MTRLLILVFSLCLAACAGMQNPDTLPRGFSQPGLPFPYNSTGW